jgi:adenine-specific DNA-methyltransferase
VGINHNLEFSNFSFNVIEYLNSLTLEKSGFDINDCFIYNNYSPNKDCKRMYFQNENAIKIDIIRLQIEKWKEEGKLSDDEYFYLLACLINAVPYVANITGVFAAYLKFWDKRTYNKLVLKKDDTVLADNVCLCCNCDYTELLSREYDVMYADPPYNAREYLPNYHVLETIARYDYPVIKGITGMREYDKQKSVFCKKNTVADAFETLVKDCKSRYIIISYNNEGLINTKQLSDICYGYAKDNSFKLIEMDYRRYKNKIPNNTNGLKEQLYVLRRN